MLFLDQTVKFYLVLKLHDVVQPQNLADQHRRHVILHFVCINQTLPWRSTAVKQTKKIQNDSNSTFRECKTNIALCVLRDEQNNLLHSVIFIPIYTKD